MVLTNILSHATHHWWDNLPLSVSTSSSLASGLAGAVLHPKQQLGFQRDITVCSHQRRGVLLKGCKWKEKNVVVLGLLPKQINLDCCCTLAFLGNPECCFRSEGRSPLLWPLALAVAIPSWSSHWRPAEPGLNPQCCCLPCAVPPRCHPHAGSLLL